MTQNLFYRPSQRIALHGQPLQGSQLTEFGRDRTGQQVVVDPKCSKALCGRYDTSQQIPIQRNEFQCGQGRPPTLRNVSRQEIFFQINIRGEGGEGRGQWARECIPDDQEVFKSPRQVTDSSRNQTGESTKAWL